MTPRPSFLAGLRDYVSLTNRGRTPIYLDYPTDPVPRFGWGLPQHPELVERLSAGRGCYEALLVGLEDVADGLRAVPLEATDHVGPCWLNQYVADLDAAMLYALSSLTTAQTYLEIGSGHTTRFVRRGIDDYGTGARIVSIDPEPRAEVDQACDVVIRTPLERVPLAVLDELASGDVVAIDGSHRCLQNSDVTVFFLEILPRLPSGVLVFIHDIFLPCDYPACWGDRYYSEQYLLAVLLMADAGRRYEITFPAHFSWVDESLRGATDRFWAGLSIPGLPRIAPCGFWLRVRDPRS